MPFDSLPLRDGLTYTNFARFESVIKAAVDSFPQPIQISWTQSGYSKSYFYNRLGDALRAFRRNKHWVSWLTPDKELILNTLSLFPSPDDPTQIVIYNTTQPHLRSLINSRARFTYSVLDSDESMLETSFDCPELAVVINSYAVLCAVKVKRLPKLRVLRNPDATVEEAKAFNDLVEEAVAGFDVTVLDHGKSVVLYQPL